VLSGVRHECPFSCFVAVLTTASIRPHPAKRAETRECPICGEHIPLRLLGQHYTLESSRVQTILDHVGDLGCFSDPHPSTHVPYVCHPCTHSRRIHAVILEYMLTQPHHRSIVRRRAALHLRDDTAAFSPRLAKTLSSIKRRRKARHMALRVVTRDDDVPAVGKGKGRTSAAAEQCPVCMQDVEGDPDVITAHVDACLAHVELHRPSGNMDTEAHRERDASLNVDDYADEGEDDVWEESETPDGARHLRLRSSARAGALALGFVIGDQAAEDVDDEIDVEGDDMSPFGATQFTEADVLTEGGNLEPSRYDTSWRAGEAEVDLAIERARHREDSQALITALESKVQLLTVCWHFLLLHR